MKAGKKIDDFMMLDENIGVFKFNNNQTATFSLVTDSASGTTTAIYKYSRSTPRFTGL
jgi:hypothetical protein